MTDYLKELMELGADLMLAEAIGNEGRKQKIIRRINDLKRKVQHAKEAEIEKLFEEQEDRERKKKQVRRPRSIGTNLGDLLREKGFKIDKEK